tara:strand:- start:2051 stop:2248 length:198 start_codon:yes stop_codon:yes gene_type:complete
MNQIEQLNATLNRGTFSKEELSLLKLLVLENLSNYDDLNVNESGNIYRMLQQLIGKINYIQRENL